MFLGLLLVGLAVNAASAAVAIGRAQEKSADHMSTGPLVSIIIPTLEEDAYLERLLQSIERQSYTPIEVVILDSSPPEAKERTRELAQQYGALMVDFPKLGISPARNAGAEAATGEALIFCDADCILSPEYAERMVLLLEQHPTAVMAHGAETVYDSFANAMLWNPWQLIKPRSHTTGRGVALWRAAFLAVGGYDESIDPTVGGREDLDLGRRVLEMYGPDAIVLDRDAMLATSVRREKVFGYTPRAVAWNVRGVREGGRQLEY